MQPSCGGCHNFQFNVNRHNRLMLSVMPPMGTFINESNANPYATPQSAAHSARSLQPIVAFLLLCVPVIVIGWPATLPPIRTFIPIPNRLLWLLTYFAPPVHWEIVCRMTPRFLAKRSSALSTVGRIVFVYVLPTITLHVGLCLMYMNTPAVTSWAIQSNSFLAASVFLAGFCFVQYDYLMARRHLLRGHSETREALTSPGADVGRE